MMDCIRKSTFLFLLLLAFVEGNEAQLRPPIENRQNEVVTEEEILFPFAHDELDSDPFDLFWTEVMSPKPSMLAPLLQEEDDTYNPQAHTSSGFDLLEPPEDKEEEWFTVDEEESSIDRKNKKPYRLKIGDTLRISIYGEPGTERHVSITPQGTIIYPFINELFVLGDTIDQVRSKMEDKLKNHFRFGVISITPTSFVGDFYTITGEIKAPGVFPHNANSTVLNALAFGGGLTTRLYRDETVEMADLTRAFLARDGEYVPVDFKKLLQEGDISQDLPLYPGDFIYIPSYQDKAIAIFGEVGFQQRLDYIDSISLVEAISMSGGVTNRASSRAVVIRGSLCSPVRYLIDINLIFKGYARDFMLQPGDILYVPARQFTNLREIVINALNTWVNLTASRAAGATWTTIVPSDTNPLEPVPVFPTTDPGALPPTIVP